MQLQFQCDAYFTQTLKKHQILAFLSYLLFIFYSKAKSSILILVSSKRESDIHHSLRKNKVQEPLSAFSYLKCEQRNYNCHPADGHRYVCPPLLSNHIHRAQEQNRPDNVIEHYQTQEGHQDPQWNTDDLKEKEINCVFSPPRQWYIFTSLICSGVGLLNKSTYYVWPRKRNFKLLPFHVICNRKTSQIVCGVKSHIGSLGFPIKLKQFKIKPT